MISGGEIVTSDLQQAEDHTPEDPVFEFGRSNYRRLLKWPLMTNSTFAEYGTVLLFATDLGIAGQLPYIKQLLEGHKPCELLAGPTPRSILYPQCVLHLRCASL